MHGFPDFDTDVRRPFAVHEDCYDRAEFYYGCNARPSNPPTHCRDYLRLLDVMPGTYGQTFPPSRMQGHKEPRLYQETAKDKPEPQSPQPTTPKRKRYMAAYMKRRRAESSASRSVSDMPFPRAGRPAKQRRIKNVNSPPLSGRDLRPRVYFCMTKRTERGDQEYGHQTKIEPAGAGVRPGGG
jgi:hypothetical protein